MSEKPNFYALLGIQPSASFDEIKAAWEFHMQRLAHQADHPPTGIPLDSFQAEIRNQQAFLRYAWDVLSNPVKKSKYDLSINQATHNATSTITEDSQEISPRKIPALLLLLLLSALGWFWLNQRHPEENSLERPAIQAQETQADLQSQLSQSQPVALPASAPDIVITSTPQGHDGIPAPASHPHSEAPTYTINVDAENSALLKKLVWSVYGIIGGRGLGTGILVEKDQLLTNCHVVAANVRAGALYAINAVTKQKTEVTEVAWLDYEDACLIRAPGIAGTPASVAPESPAVIGTRTHNIGFAKGQLTGSQGELIGWANRFGQNFMVTSNYCDHGVSGGPLVDDDGRLIGLTSGGPDNHAYCLSVTVETIADLRRVRLKPLSLFPDFYESNVSRKL